MKNFKNSEIAMQEKGQRAFEREKKGKKEEELSINVDQIKAIVELLEKSPRSTIINIGATPELVQVMDKAEVVVNYMHELAYGKDSRDHNMADALLKIFRKLDEKIDSIATRLNEFETVKTEIDYIKKSTVEDATQAGVAEDSFAGGLQEDAPAAGETREDPVAAGEVQEDTAAPGELPEGAVAAGEHQEDAETPGGYQGDPVAAGEVQEDTAAPGELPEGAVAAGEVQEDTLLPGEQPEGAVAAGEHQEYTVTPGGYQGDAETEGGDMAAASPGQAPGDGESQASDIFLLEGPDSEDLEPVDSQEEDTSYPAAGLEDSREREGMGGLPQEGSSSPDEIPEEPVPEEEPLESVDQAARLPEEAVPEEIMPGETLLQDAVFSGDAPPEEVAGTRGQAGGQEELPGVEDDGLSSRDQDNGQFEIKGYHFRGIPYKESSKGRIQFDWKRADDQEEALKTVLIQLKEQGVDIYSTFRLKEAGFESIYAKYRLLELHKIMPWKAWVITWAGKPSQ